MTDESAWAETENHWNKFLNDVRLARAAVGATYAGAWFRGQVHSWDLSPSIYRELPKLEAQITTLRKDIVVCESKLTKARRYLKRQGLTSDDEVTLRFANELERLCKHLARLEQRRPQDGHIHGEGRAFVEFRFRSASYHQSSWQTLAEMQHYGVPTRLLDWTESFIHALAFALQNYASMLTAAWTKDRYSDSPPPMLRWHPVRPTRVLENGESVEEVPTIWILNPYNLAEKAGRGNVLWDPTLRPSEDYYQLFVAGDIEKQWHVPMPILSPWRDERVAAQRGVFTCHGKDVQPLNEQVRSRIVRPVHISHEAAIHGVRFLSDVGALDRFAMFRDKDSLGRKTRDEFLSLP